MFADPIPFPPTLVTSAPEVTAFTTALTQPIPFSKPSPLFLHLHHSILTLHSPPHLAVFDLQRLPLSTLHPLLTKPFNTAPSRLYVATSSVSTAALLGPLHLNTPPLTFDIQLAREVLDGTCNATLLDTARVLGIRVPDLPVLPKKLKAGTNLDPIARYACFAMDVYTKLNQRLAKAKLDVVIAASRWQMGYWKGIGDDKGDVDGAVAVAVAFDGKTFKMGSRAVLRAVGGELVPSVKAGDSGAEFDKMAAVMPAQWAEKLRPVAGELVDVVLDVGRRPLGYLRGGKKVCVGEGQVVEEEHLRHLEGVVGKEGTGFNSENRGGFERSLHRVAVLRSGVSGDVVGATVRMGRSMQGVAGLLYDVLLQEQYVDDSILLLGPPGSGKTTMMRDIARVLARTKRVMIVDSCNELGGHGVVPHESIGDARRMSVPGGKRQLAASLIEALENHTPDVLVADELSDRDEVNGACTANRRGVRMVASAHGCLRSIVENGKLRGLVGGTTQVIVGDRLAGVDGKRKVQAVRPVEPDFNVIVELGVGGKDRGACRVIRDAGCAVDAILEGKQYECEMRTWGSNNDIFVTKVTA